MALLGSILYTDVALCCREVGTKTAIATYKHIMECMHSENSLKMNDASHIGHKNALINRA